MSEVDQPEVVEGLLIRPYERRDQQAIDRLYTEGLLAGQIAPNDTGADLDNVEAAYFDSERHHFWVAEVDGQIRGMIGVASDEPHTAEIRRLRVAPAYQASDLGERLLATAIKHCRHHGFLKVRLDTFFEKGAAMSMFDRAGFDFTRTRSLHGKELLEFYVDLYHKADDAPRE